jgi:hypothetical protein
MNKLSLLLVVAGAGCMMAEDARVKIYEGCDDSSTVRAEVPRLAELTVRFAISGGAPCYSIRAIVKGESVDGYVLDPALPAVRAFEKARAMDERESFANPIPLPDPPKRAVVAEETKPKQEQPKPEATPVKRPARPDVAM